MKKYVYIKKSIAKQYVEFESPLSPEEYNNIGETWQDYLDNKWVLLSDEQIAFHNEHLSALVKEVWDMQITPTPPRTLEQAKQEKLAEIENFDSSNDVNGFDVIKDGNTVSDWLTPDKRANYRNSIDAAKLVGLESLSLYIGGIPISISTQMAEMMLAQIQLYADQCFIVTKQHEAAVEVLESIEAVDAYDVSVGYP